MNCLLSAARLLVNQAANAMASLVIAIYVEIWLTVGIELWSAINLLGRWVVNKATYAMTTAISRIRRDIAGRMAVILVV